MKVLLSWLHEHLPTQPTADEVRNGLLSVGIEVSGVKNLAAGLEKVVVGKIIERNQHPDADRLTLCKVTDGKENFSIVCGATNHKAGDHVALAYIGATLPNGVTLKRTKIRGVESEGMLCSEKELGFSEESEGIIILPETAPVGTPLAEYLKRNDVVFDLEISPNRGDCLSVIGVAREVAAALGISSKAPFSDIEGPKSGKMSAFVHDQAACPRYVLHHIGEIKVGPSPEMIVGRLNACDVRSINNVVDITNYIMLEWGQPLHSFDQEKVVGTLQVRRAKKNEKIVCLDESEQILSEKDLVIADDQGPLALAGVMGGMRASVTENTKSILLESACFDPKTVRATSKRFNLRTESSHRFERGVDRAITWGASLKASNLLADFAKGKVLSSLDLQGPPSERIKISFRKSTMERILGEEEKNTGEYLTRLGLGVEKTESGWRVEIPTRRPDLMGEIDLVEEVARLHGYEKFPSTIPELQKEPKIHAEYFAIDHLRDILTGGGFTEAINYSFASQKENGAFDSPSGEAIAVVNPIATDQEWMRQTLLPGLIRNWKLNESRQKHGVRLFEIGRVFGKGGGGVSPAKEELRLAVCLAGVIEPQTWFRKEEKTNYFDGKGVLESIFENLQVGGFSFEPIQSSSWLHAGKAAKVLLRKKEIGVVGEVHPRLLRTLDVSGPVVICEVALSPILEAIQTVRRFKPLSIFPTVERDLAFFMKKEGSAEKVVAEVKKLRDPLISNVEIFDFYSGKGVPEGEVSLAIRVTFGALDRTLKDEEIDLMLKKIVAQIQMTCSAKLRGEL